MNQLLSGGAMPPNFSYDVEPCLIRHREDNEFIHRIHLKAAPPERRTVDLYASMHTVEGSQEFLEQSDVVSKLISKTMISWAAKYLGFQIGTQDALEFLSGNIPAEYEVHKLFSQIETHIMTALLKDLTRVLALNDLSCDSNIVASLLSTGSSNGTPPKPETGEHLMDRFMRIAKEANDRVAKE